MQAGFLRETGRAVIAESQFGHVFFSIVVIQPADVRIPGIIIQRSRRGGLGTFLIRHDTGEELLDRKEQLAGRQEIVPLIVGVLI